MDSLVDLHIASIVSPQDWHAKFPIVCRIETMFGNLSTEVALIRDYSERFRDRLNVVEKYLTSDKVIATVRNTCTQLGLSSLCNFFFKFKISFKII